jgi:hypothetical protein
MKNKKVIAIVLLIQFNMLAQYQYTCGTDTTIMQTPGPSSVICTELLKDFKPMQTAAESVLEVNLNIIVFRPNATPGSGAWGTPTEADLQIMIADANWIFANNNNPAGFSTPNYPVPGVIELAHTKIRLVLKSYSINVLDANVYSNLPNAAGNQLYYDEQAVNVYFGGGGGSADAYVPGQHFPGKVICFQSTIPKSISAWYMGNVLAHEIGHAVGALLENNRQSIVSANFGCCNLLWPDDYIMEGPSTWVQCGGVDANNNPPFNNLISLSTGCQKYLSPLQMAMIHYHLRSSHLKTLTPASQAYVKNVNTSFDLNITNSQIWQGTQVRYMKGNIIVKAGNTLTMKCKTYMTNGSKIVVEKGARLIVDGGEVTTWYPNTLWKGIEVEGTYGGGQLIYNPTGLAQDFGIVKVINGGTISNAHNGITNARSNNVGDIIWGNQGGIIQCDNANFINNIRDVQFLAYQNPYGNDLSKFTYCNFKVDNNVANLVNAGFGLITRVSLWEVHGVSFLGCNFEYSAGNAIAPGNRGYGIYSQNARYLVDQICNDNNIVCASYTKTQFLNFEMGIRVENTNPLRVVSIKNTNFYDNLATAVYLNSMNYAVFEDNYIRATGGYSWGGMHINNCKYYNIRNNTFLLNYSYVESQQKTGAGIYVSHSKFGVHQIYRNIFSNFNVGIAAVGDNSGQQNNEDGLRMNCNEFTKDQKINNYDISLLPNIEPPTVMVVQGEILNQFKTPINIVRNLYAATCNTLFPERKWHIQGVSVKNYLHGIGNTTAEDPGIPDPACKDQAVLVTNNNEVAPYCPANNIPNACDPPCPIAINQALVVAAANVNSLSALFDPPVPPELNPNSALERKLILARYDLQAVVATKMNYFLTSNNEGSQDSVIRMLQANVGHMRDADVQLVYAHINKGDYSLALNQANTISADTNGAKAAYGAMLAKLVAFEGNSKKVFNIVGNSSDSAFFANHANTTGIGGQGAAQALLKFVFGQDYDIPHPTPGSEDNARSSNDVKEQIPVLIGDENISVYPNPTQTGINIVYNGQEGDAVLIEITDLLGKVIDANFSVGLSKHYVPLNDLNSGLYLITLTKDKEVIYRSKLIKQD